MDQAHEGHHREPHQAQADARAGHAINPAEILQEMEKTHDRGQDQAGDTAGRGDYAFVKRVKIEVINSAFMSYWLN